MDIQKIADAYAGRAGAHLNPGHVNALRRALAEYDTQREETDDR